MLSYSSIKNSASSEQKRKPKVAGEAIFYNQKQLKGFTELYGSEQTEQGDKGF